MIRYLITVVQRWNKTMTVKLPWTFLRNTRDYQLQLIFFKVTHAVTTSLIYFSYINARIVYILNTRNHKLCVYSSNFDKI